MRTLRRKEAFACNCGRRDRVALAIGCPEHHPEKYVNFLAARFEARPLNVTLVADSPSAEFAWLVVDGMKALLTHEVAKQVREAYRPLTSHWRHTALYQELYRRFDHPTAVGLVSTDHHEVVQRLKEGIELHARPRRPPGPLVPKMLSQPVADGPKNRVHPKHGHVVAPREPTYQPSVERGVTYTAKQQVTLGYGRVVGLLRWWVFCWDRWMEERLS